MRVVSSAICTCGEPVSASRSAVLADDLLLCFLGEGHRASSYATPQSPHAARKARARPRLRSAGRVAAKPFFRPFARAGATADRGRNTSRDDRGPVAAAGHPATVRRRARDPRGGRERGGRGRRRLPGLVRGRDGDDRAARRRPRDLLRRADWPGAEPRLLRRRARPRAPSGGRSARASSRCRSARSSSTTRSASARAACPGVPAGLDALWRAHGRLPWPRLVEPALRLARDGRRDAPRPRRLPRDARAGDDDARGRADLLARRAGCSTSGDRLAQPGLVAALELVAEEGARASTRARSARSLLALIDERGGLVTRDDLAAYEARWASPSTAEYHGAPLLTRAASPACQRRSRGCPRCAASTSRSAPSRSSKRSRDVPDRTGTRRTSSRSTDDGNACVLTTSLGLGSGDCRARLRPAPEQHARRGRPARRRARARRADGEHDGADRSRSTRRRSRSRSAPPAARGCAARSSRCVGVLDEGSSRRRPSTGRAAPGRSVVNVEPGSPTASRTRSRGGLHGARLAGRHPLLRRRQPRHAARRRRRSATERRLSPPG